MDGALFAHKISGYVEMKKKHGKMLFIKNLKWAIIEIPYLIIIYNSLYTCFVFKNFRNPLYDK